MTNNNIYTGCYYWSYFTSSIHELIMHEGQMYLRRSVRFHTIAASLHLFVVYIKRKLTLFYYIAIVKGIIVALLIFL